MTVQNIREGQAPRVSVLMSVYNGERYLRDAIESILGQTYTDFEFVIINDGSVDSSRDIVLSYQDSRINLIDNEKNIGLTRSLNRGLALARGEYIARQDADDVSLSRRLEAQVLFLDDHPDVAVLGGQAIIVDESGTTINIRGYEKPVSEHAFQWLLMFNSPFYHSAVMFRTEVIRDKYHGYDEHYITSQDCELWARVAVGHKMANLPDILIKFRSHKGTVSRQYRHHDILKVGKVYEGTIKHVLRSEDDYSTFVKGWLHVTNPKAFEQYRDIAKMLHEYDQIEKRFTSLFPESRDNKEVLMQRSHILNLCARYFAEQKRLSSFRFLARSLRNGQTSVMHLLRYLIVLVGFEKCLRLVGMPSLRRYLSYLSRRA